jgi:hypothetical protein
MKHVLHLFLIAGRFGSQVPGVERISDIPYLLRSKNRLLSIYVNGNNVPSNRSAILETVIRRGLEYSVPIYYTNSQTSEENRLKVYKEAFESFRFSLIIPSDSRSIEPALVHAIWQHTVPVYNGFFHLSTMFPNGVVRWSEDPSKFDLVALVTRLRNLNLKIRFLWSYQQIMQEVLWYRYGSPLSVRMSYINEVLPRASKKLSLAVVGIYSALQNVDLRQAIRSTWGASLQRAGIEVLFFLSGHPDKAGIREKDLVFLPVVDGYKNNSRKGVLFLQWLARNRASTTKFLIKADDDIFWNPQPLLTQLTSIQPVGYVWGFIDYISPVPRNMTSPFFSSPAVYPFPTFPTYPRGLLRVLSMDIVEAIAEKADRLALRMIFGDDPCFGVHLRQVRVDHTIPFIRIDDFASYTRFAMEPTCNKTAWRAVTNDSWVIHHVNASQILCLHNSNPFPDCSCFYLNLCRLLQ